MEQGVGGRIEAAFEASKEKGEAAFISFITAGYPTAQGAYFEFFSYLAMRFQGSSYFESNICLTQFLR
jgi:tryptophan synthase alpha subunit